VNAAACARSAGRFSGALPRVIRAVALALVVLAGLPVAAGQAASGPKRMFVESFTPANPRQWSVLSLADGSRTYLSGNTYRIVRAHPGIMRGWPLSVRVPSGVQFTATFKLVSGSDPFEGISFRDDWGDNFDLFAITPGGEAALLRHRHGAWTPLVDWRVVSAVRRGLGSVNTLSVNLDNRSAAQGRTFVINGVPLGKPCDDAWLKVLGNEPRVVGRRLSVGLVAGSFNGAALVAVLQAGMINATQTGIKADHSVC
jgi:hypothetical protein